MGEDEPPKAKKSRRKKEGEHIVEEGDWMFDDKKYKGPRLHTEFLPATYHYLKATRAKEEIEQVEFEHIWEYYLENFAEESRIWNEDDVTDYWMALLKKKRKKEEKKAKRADHEDPEEDEMAAPAPAPVPDSADPENENAATAPTPFSQESAHPPTPPPPPPPGMKRGESEVDLDLSLTDDGKALAVRAQTAILAEEAEGTPLRAEVAQLANTTPAHSPRGATNADGRTVTSTSGNVLRIGRGRPYQRRGDPPTPTTATATATGTDQTSTSSASEPPTPTPPSVLPSNAPLSTKSQTMVSELLSMMKSKDKENQKEKIQKDKETKEGKDKVVKPEATTEPDSDSIPFAMQKIAATGASTISLRDMATKWGTDTAAAGAKPCIIEESTDLCPAVLTVEANKGKSGPIPTAQIGKHLESLQRVLHSGAHLAEYPSLATPQGEPCSVAYFVSLDDLKTMRVTCVCSGWFSYASHVGVPLQEPVRYVEWRRAEPSSFLSTTSIAQLVGDGWSSKVVGASRLQRLTYLLITLVSGAEIILLFAPSYIGCVATVPTSGAPGKSFFPSPVSQILNLTAPIEKTEKKEKKFFGRK